MNETSVFAAPVLAFFSRPFYKHIALKGKGLGFGYLFLLVLASWTLNSAHIYLAADAFCKSDGCTTFINQIPQMTWKDSKLSIDKPMPYAITLTGQPISTRNPPLAYFDTTGKMKTLADADPAPMLLTEDGFSARKDTGDQHANWKELVQNAKFGPDDARTILKNVPGAVAGLMWALGIFVFLTHLIQACIYGAFGMLMDRNKLGYGTAVRLAAFAMTPAIVLSTIKDLTFLPINYIIVSLVSMVLTMGYLYFAFTSVPSTELSDDQVIR